MRESKTYVRAGSATDDSARPRGHPKKGGGAPGACSDDPFGLFGGCDSARPEEWDLRAQLDAVLEAATATAEAGGARKDTATDDDVCPDCGSQMHRSLNNLEYVCGGCGLVVEGDTAETEECETARSTQVIPRLRIVGPGSKQLQPDLYRSGVGSTPASQTEQIYKEYCEYRQRYIESGGRAFPLNACARAAACYNVIQRQCVRRSENKKTIMAACLWRTCIQIDFAPSKTEIACFMQLASKGIARGDNFVRSLAADKKIEIDLDADVCRPEIDTLFMYLGYGDPQYDGLREAVHDIVRTAVENSIGTSSILHSKVAGATYVVLCRCKDSRLVPKRMTLKEFCQPHIHIRKNTVERFAQVLDRYHSYFVECYRRAGLDDGPAP